MSAFRYCRFCQGRGCLCCESEIERYSKKAAEPIFVAHIDNPQEMATLKRVFGRGSLDHAFGPKGGGMLEIYCRLLSEKIDATDTSAVLGTEANE